MKIFEIPAETSGVFLKRPNRFLALVELSDGRTVEAHLHDPGRLPDLAVPGRPVLLRSASNPRRKTRWDVLAFRREDYWCFCHSGYHRKLTANLLFKLSPFGDFEEFHPEPRVGEGRLDFRLKGAAGELYLEVKGVTWARGHLGLFPDAPTLRGLRHLQTLRELLRSGLRAGLLFLVFRQEVQELRPAEEIQPAFAATLRAALAEGLKARALVLSYDGRTVYFERFVPVRA